MMHKKTDVKTADMQDSRTRFDCCFPIRRPVESNGHRERSKHDVYENPDEIRAKAVKQSGNEKWSLQTAKKRQAAFAAILDWR